MKYGSLKPNALKTFKVRDFSGGVNLSEIPSDISDIQLSDVKNMRHIGGALSTRPGLSANANDIIGNDTMWYSDAVSFKVTDNSFYIDGEYKKIAIAEYFAEDAHYYCFIYFVGIDGSKTAAGSITFNRTSNDCFYKPSNILFYSGTPVNGGGIFALVSSYDEYNPEERGYEIYEISSDMTKWVKPYDYYTPVVYINGRGNRYEEAKASNLAFTGQPKILESRNMLTSRFKAYFTSDGHSGCFRLPFTGLADESVICRVYTNPSQYTEWFISGNVTSATATFYTATITLNVDRAKGMIYFTDAEGEYPVPMMSMYHENNICVTAGKEMDNGFNSAASSTVCAVYGSEFIFSGGCEKGKVFCVSASNPLYFPEDSSAQIGGDEKGINALIPYKNGIIVYKDDEIYSLELKKGEPINSNSLLADDDSVFFKSATFSAKKINGNIGCVNKATAVLCGNRPVWLGNDGNIHSLNTSSWETENLSAAIEPYLNSIGENGLKTAFAIGNGTQYMLIAGEKAVIMEYTQNELNAVSAKWYIWDFGSVKVIGAAENGGKQRFFCTGSDGYIFYSAVLSGETDADICYGSTAPVITARNILSCLTTKRFDFGGMTDKKLIENICLSLSSVGTVDIAVNGQHFDRLRLGIPDTDYGCGTLKSVKIIPHMYGTESVCITLSGDDAFSLGELSVNYREVR